MRLFGGNRSLQARPAPLHAEFGVRKIIIFKKYNEEVGVETVPIVTDEGVALTFTLYLLHEHVLTTAPPVYTLFITARGSTSTCIEPGFGWFRVCSGTLHVYVI